MNLSHLLSAAAIAGAVAAGSTASAATVGLGADLYATGGLVTATFEGSDAGYASELYLAGAEGDTLLFNNKTTPVGTSLDLGTFAAGAALKFFIKVLDTGYAFYTGDGSDNPDGEAHALVSSDDSGRIYVGFEDLFGGGDRDYNDLNFSFTNLGTDPAPVPLPAAGLLMVGALGGLGLLRRRR